MSTGEHDLDPSTSTAEAAEASEGAEGSGSEAPPKKLELDVEITDVGPCKKHLKVAISRNEINNQFEESLGKMQREAQVPGFRPGHAPRTLVEKRFRKEMGKQVKSVLVMAALEQIDKEQDLQPIAQPNLDVDAIDLPDDGPMTFEMDVEVRPEFELPNYKSLVVKRPTRALTDADVEAQYKVFLERHAQLVPKLEGGAELGDFVTADLQFHDEGRAYNEVKEVQFRLQPELRFQDGAAPNVGEALRGVKPGEDREVEVKIGSGSPDPALRGRTIQARFAVQDLKVLRLPEVDAAFLERVGFDSDDDLRFALREVLERRLEAQQQQAVRREVLDHLIAKTPFDLPEELVRRQEKSTLARIVSKMKQDGFSESDIRAREAEIRANAKETTLRSLKEFFLLAKVAEAEGIEVKDEDFDLEIESIADRSDESPRRVRARIEKEGLSDAIASDLLERKTLECIFKYVTFEEVPLVEEAPVETLDNTASAISAEEAESAEAANETPAD